MFPSNVLAILFTSQISFSMSEWALKSLGRCMCLLFHSMSSKTKNLRLFQHQLVRNSDQFVREWSFLKWKVIILPHNPIRILTVQIYLFEKTSMFIQLQCNMILLLMTKSWRFRRFNTIRLSVLSAVGLCNSSHLLQHHDEKHFSFGCQLCLLKHAVSL